MKIHLKGWLKFVAICSATLVAFSAPVPLVQANTRSPDHLAGSVTISQQGDLVTINYPASQSQRHHRIYHAVWSDENGQDDIVWHQAGAQSTTFNLSQHRGQGLYYAHTYININGRMVGLNATSFQVSRPVALTSTVKSLEAGVLELRVDQVPSHFKELVIPTWSDKGGQDDIRWYRVKRGIHGLFSLRVNLEDHHSDLGVYHFHIYGINPQTGGQEILASQGFEVKAQHLPKTGAVAPQFSVESLDKSRGTYRVTGTDRGRTIESASLAVWSTDNQSNIKWYPLTQDGSGNYSTEVSLLNHQQLAGHYHNHLYLTYTDGSQTSHALQRADLTSFRPPISLSSSYLGNGLMGLTFHHKTWQQSILYAVWSEVGGQDDLRWYSLPNSGNAQIDLAHHQGEGTFHVHAYEENNLVVAHSFQVTSDMKPLPKTISTNHYQTGGNHEVNTYPIGECTWGVKELAPWVGNYWGNARDWYTTAQSLGFEVGNQPQVGAVAVWPEDGIIGGYSYGHVALVTQVESDTRIQVEEANYAGKRYVANFRGWFDPNYIWKNGQYVASKVYYIYPEG